MLSSYVATGKPTMAIQTAQVKLSKNKKHIVMNMDKESVEKKKTVETVKE